MSNTNQRRRVRRKAENKKNELQSKKQIKFDQKDKVMLKNAEGIRNRALKNSQKIDNIEVQITGINRNLQKMENSIQNWEENELNPKIDAINSRLDEICYLIFDMADALAFDIDDKRYAKLGFEIDDSIDDNIDNSIDDADVTEVEVLDDDDSHEEYEEIDKVAE